MASLTRSDTYPYPQGDLREAERLLSFRPELVMACNSLDQQPLHIAAANGRCDVCELLLLRAAQVYAPYIHSLVGADNKGKVCGYDLSGE